MPVPYASAGKSLKKQKAKAVKAKMPIPAKKSAPLALKGKPLFTPPGMDAEDKIDGGVDEKTEKN
jgi:hypothetical protein